MIQKGKDHFKLNLLIFFMNDLKNSLKGNANRH